MMTVIGPRGTVSRLRRVVVPITLTPSLMTATE